MIAPNVYNIEWEPKRPENAPSMVRLFVPPVVGACVRVPMSNGYTRTYRVLMIVPFAYNVDHAPKADDYAAEIALLAAASS